MPSTKALLTIIFVLAMIAAVSTTAAVMLWLNRAPQQPAQPGAQIVAGGPPTAATPASSIASASSAATVAPPQQASGVFINQKEATAAQLAELRQTYGQAPPPGRYWYDARSGLYGMWGHEAAGYIKPGHNFGPLPANASNGDTGVFINGRQINMTEAMFFQRIFGAVYQGRWWLDGTNGNVGQEGSDVAIANVVLALQQAQRSAGGGAGGGYRWRDNITNSSGGAENGCVWLNMPGSSYSSSGCG